MRRRRRDRGGAAEERVERREEASGGRGFASRASSLGRLRRRWGRMWSDMGVDGFNVSGLRDGGVDVMASGD